MNFENMNFVNKGFALLAVIFSALYIINPTAGIFEFLPDNIPFLGNLDEAMAAGILLAALKYLGLDLLSYFTPKSKDEVKKNKYYDIS